MPRSTAAIVSVRANPGRRRSDSSRELDGAIGESGPRWSSAIEGETVRLSGPDPVPSKPDLSSSLPRLMTNLAKIGTRCEQLSRDQTTRASKASFLLSSGGVGLAREREPTQAGAVSRGARAPPTVEGKPSLTSSQLTWSCPAKGSFLSLDELLPRLLRESSNSPALSKPSCFFSGAIRSLLG